MCFQVLQSFIGRLWQFARHPSVNIAFATDWIRRCQIDKRRLFKKPDSEMKFFRHALRGDMALAGPNNVFDVKTIIVMLVALPNSNLEDNLMREVLF